MPRLQFHPVDYASAIGFLAYSSSALVTPIALLEMSRELNFNLGQGGFIDVMRHGLILVSLLAGALAVARFSKARLLGVGSLVMGVGLLLNALAPTYGLLLMAMALVGIGSGASEGLINPLVQDAHPKDSGRYLNIVNGFWSIGVLVTVLVVGELLTRDISWRAIVFVLSGVSIVSGVLFLLVHARAPHVPARPMREAVSQMTTILRTRRFWLFVAAIFFGGGAEGAYTFWTASYIQLEYGQLPRAGGIGTACFAAGMVIGRFAFGMLVTQQHLRRLIIGSAGAGLLLSILVPHVPNLLALYGLLVLAGLSVACFWPTIQSYAADRLPVDSTSLFILLSCSGIPGFALVAWIMGLIADHASLHTSFLLVPTFFGLLLITMAIDLVTHRKNTKS